MARLYIMSNNNKMEEKILIIIGQRFACDFSIVLFCSTHVNGTVDGNEWAAVVTVDRLYLVAMLRMQWDEVPVPALPNR